MRRSSLILLFLSLILIACSRKRELLLSRWEKKAVKPNYVSRTLASSPNQCLSDLYSVETLKKEIKELEAPYMDSKPVLGYWRGLDLSKFTIPEAQFLKTYGDQLGDLNDSDAFDFSACTNVACVFNTIYRKGDSVEGYVHYLWYLKFGHLLSASNLIPGQAEPTPGKYNAKEHPIENYFFSSDELFGFWRLSHILTVPYTSLSELKEIHRIPRGELIEGQSPLTCGYAHSSGYIVLNDGCLGIDQNKERGYFYVSVTHEMSHHIDFSQGNKYGQGSFYRSTKDDYLKLTGFSLKEFVQDGITYRQWVLPDPSSAVSSYATTTPMENFAESLSRFRHTGDDAVKKMRPEQSSFVSKEYFQTRYFTQDALISRWLSTSTRDLSLETMKMLDECMQVSIFFRPSDFFAATDFSSPLSFAALQCLGDKAQSLESEIRADVLKQDPQGCGVLTSSTGKGLWEKTFKQQLLKILNTNLQSYSADPGAYQRLAEAYKILDSSDFAREAYFTCPENKECYEEGLQETLVQKIALPETDQATLIHRYLDRYPYELMRDEIRRGYQNLLLAFNDKIIEATDSLWKSCKLVPLSDTEPPTGNFFSIPNGYLVSSIYNCVNLRYTNSLDTILSSISIEGQRFSDPLEKKFAVDAIKPIMTDRLLKLYTLDSMEELRQAQAIIQLNRENILSTLKLNPKWMRGFGKLLSACQAQVTSLVKFEPVFSLEKELFYPLLEKDLCLTVSQNSSFSASFKTQLDLSVNDYRHSLLEEVLTLMVDRAKGCASQFRGKKTQLESCAYASWVSFEQSVFKKHKEDQFLKDWGEPDNWIIRNIEINRTYLRDRLGQVLYKL